MIFRTVVKSYHHRKILFLFPEVDLKFYIDHKNMKLVIRILATAFIVVALSKFLPGSYIDNYFTGIWVAIVLALINVFIKPLLVILTLPVTVLTFGLFLLVINALLILLSSELVSGFHIDGFWWALLFSLLLSFFQSVLFSALEKKNENLRR